MPLFEKDKDYFNRKQFSKKVFQIVTHENSIHCITVGLYGKWGEGKTSVLNDLETLCNDSSDIYCVRFNPWGYETNHDAQKALIMKLADRLRVQIIPWYSKIIAFLYSIIKAIKPSFKHAFEDKSDISASIGLDDIKVLSNVAKGIFPATYQLKERLNNVISKMSCQIVVLIDDIDRLESNEMQDLFRFIKTNTDFIRTRYVLAFDDVVVSKAVGESYVDDRAVANDKLIAGRNFLEKIIQYQVRIPKPRYDELFRFFYDRVNDTFREQGYEYPEEAGNKRSIHKILQPLLTTPRQAIRFSNDLRVDLANIGSEVSVRDLLYVEILKHFMPETFHFCASNPGILANVISINTTITLDEPGIKRVSSIIDNHLKGYQDDSIQASAQFLIEALFPKIENIMSSRQAAGIGLKIYGLDEGRDKRACSYQHFFKFFYGGMSTYDILSVEVTNLLDANLTDEDTSFASIVDRVGYENLLEEFKFKFGILQSDERFNLSRVLVNGWNSIPDDHHSLLPLVRLKDMALELIFKCNTIPNNPKLSESMLSSLIDQCTNSDIVFELGLQVYRNIDEDSISEGHHVLGSEEGSRLLGRVIKRLLIEHKGLDIFSKFSGYSIMTFWNISHGIGQLRDYVDKYLSRREDYVIVINSLARKLISNSGEYMGNLSDDAILMLKSILGRAHLEVLKSFVDPSVYQNIPKSNDTWAEYSDDERLAQYVYLVESKAID